MMKRVLVTGSSGMLGSAVVSALSDKYDIYGMDTYCPNEPLMKQFNVDLRYADSVRRAIDAIRPEIVIHCAAITDVERCEEDYHLAYDTNAQATKNLIECVGNETRFIYVSTDSVFDGRRGNYTEEDEPSPLNNYAKTKLEGERFVEGLLRSHVVIRTNIFGRNRVHGASFAEWLLKSLREKRPIRMWTDVIFSPLSVNTLTAFMERLLNTDFAGRINIASRDSVSKYGFGMLFANFFGFDGSLIKPASIDEFGFKARRPKNTSLDVTMASSIFKELPTVKDELEGFCREYQFGN